MIREITCVALDMTTHCDRRCPDCCAGIGINRTLQHHDWAYFERAANVLRGVERVHLTGGEPTLHPKFAEFVPCFKALFGCTKLTLQTDGWGVERHRDVIANCIDETYGSRYAENAAKIDALLAIKPATMLWEGKFTPRAQRGSGHPCQRGYSETVAYQDGKLHGCCVGAGVDGAVGMEPVADWRVAILEHPLPCRDCWFSPGAEV